jgi:hypothetical protein
MPDFSDYFNDTDGTKLQDHVVGGTTPWDRQTGGDLPGENDELQIENKAVVTTSQASITSSYYTHEDPLASDFGDTEISLLMEYSSNSQISEAGNTFLRYIDNENFVMLNFQVDRIGYWEYVGGSTQDHGSFWTRGFYLEGEFDFRAEWIEAENRAIAYDENHTARINFVANGDYSGAPYWGLGLRSNQLISPFPTRMTEIHFQPEPWMPLGNRDLMRGRARGMVRGMSRGGR